MGLSKVRANIPEYREPEVAGPAEGDMKAFEVFIQLERGKPHVYAGSVDAADAAMALRFAREHYGRDQPCVQVWVCPRDAIARTEYDKDVVWRLSDQSYRLAKGYAVAQKWKKFRAERDYEEYRREDIKEHF